MMRRFLSILMGVLLISIGSLFLVDGMSNSLPSGLISGNFSTFKSCPENNDNSTREIIELNASLRNLLFTGDYNRCPQVIKRILNEIEVNNFNDNILSESYYYIGVFHLLTTPVSEAIKYLNRCISIKEKNLDVDIIYAKALYNLGALHARTGDYKKHEEYSLRSLDMEKKIYGEASPSLISTYSSLIGSFIQQQEYERSINYSNIALSIAANYPDSVAPSIMADLYSNLGACYSRLADYTKADIYFSKAEFILKNNQLDNPGNYINLLNSMAISFRALGLSEKSDLYYERGVTLAASDNSYSSFNIINSYALILGNSDNALKGESLLKGILDRAKIKFGEDSHFYVEVLRNYADFLSEYNIDNDESLRCYAKCTEYLNRNPYETNLKTRVLTGYARALAKAGKPVNALEKIQTLLFSGNGIENNKGLYDNPDSKDIIPDRNSLNIFRTKYNIIRNIYKDTNDQNVLLAASNTAELIVAILEKVRINISEEDSRLILGDNYRDSYLNAINDFYELYSITGSRIFFEKAFEYSEKSKVAGLLASTRELKATQFHIPDSIANFEESLQRNISLFNARITEESGIESPDSLLIYMLKDNLLKATRMRDSLILVFEKKYPDYYAIKYNTEVAGLADIQMITGRNGNYINYVVSDTLLYIFITNRKHQQLIAIPIDSDFIGNIKTFRTLLLKPSPSEDAFDAFEQYKSLGYKLYETLILPVRNYIISDRILISPDNILSYIPFEALPTSTNSGEGILYREIPYLMNEFTISYTYSATFMAELAKRDHSIRAKVISFAPNYPDPIDIQSVLMMRQSEKGLLYDLPFAREEAGFVSDITGGDLFINSAAKESVYKAEAGKYDIIHLAMHTLLNDKDPMHSMLIFSSENDTIEDGFLKTYEVYGIPLISKMVVLSSCNTGGGVLYSGEGILSLARGFIYSGSQSVVMSMWEVEDRSGTEIIRMFYNNLRRGNSKSVALKKARIAYLKKADQLRSHPYFWATLIVYGNNSPLFFTRLWIYTAIFIMILATLTIRYLRKRKYS